MLDNESEYKKNMLDKELEYRKGFNAGFEDYPDDSMYATITVKDVASDEWNRGYVQGFNEAKSKKNENLQQEL